MSIDQPKFAIAHLERITYSQNGDASGVVTSHTCLGTFKATH
jgi:hypothetical protein